MKIRAIITGATGMVGEGVLRKCLLHKMMPKFVSTLSEVATGMINSVLIGSDKSVLEVTDIVALSKNK